MEKQTIQFNNQEWEEIFNAADYYKLSINERLKIILEGKMHYYRLIPLPETFPKIFGAFEVDKDGYVFLNHYGHRIEMFLPVDFNNLKLALAESERIRSRQ